MVAGVAGTGTGGQLLNRNSASFVIDEETEFVDQQWVLYQVRVLGDEDFRHGRASARRWWSERS